MSAQIKVPDELKADVPPTQWGKVLAATPIVMTVIATLLAGLSSSEMTRAQYDRALAAQQQSKAGDQWNYFQAKRLRAALQRNTLDVIHGTAPARAPDPAAFSSRFSQTGARAVIETDGGRQAVESLSQGNLPSMGPDAEIDPRIASALTAVDAGRSDAEIAQLLAPVGETDLAAALRDAGARVRRSDATLKPVNQAIDAIEKELLHPTGGVADGTDALAREFVAARLWYAAQRYDMESRQNQVIAQLYELQVRKSNLSAERHHARSQRFFYGMLAAQMGVIISTFSMAARKQNFLWALAAAAGTGAVAFAAYVYLFV
ncbi:MAG: hypothetical protein JWM88_806 [Verrucomicrobia bacterium]|nr:hypothetical protein [Verrucomicrobiota bacterium]